MSNPSPGPSRPMEYISLFISDIPTEEGTVFLFLAYDPYMDVLMNLAMEDTCDINAFLKSIFYLGEDPLFLENRGETFFLVIDSFKKEQKRIDKMLESMGGKSIYDRRRQNKVMQALAKNLDDFNQSKMGRTS